VIGEQDVSIGRQVQRGLASRFAAPGRMSWTEEHVAKFNRWLVKSYANAPVNGNSVTT